MVIIKLNVGGIRYETTDQTLLKGGIYFTNLIDPKFNSKDETTGEYFIDRSGRLFDYVLNFLRDGVVSIDSKHPDYGGVKREFGYYSLAFPEKKKTVEKKRIQWVVDIEKRAVEDYPKIKSYLSDFIKSDRVTNNLFQIIHVYIFGSNPTNKKLANHEFLVPMDNDPKNIKRKHYCNKLISLIKQDFDCAPKYCEGGKIKLTFN